MKLTDLLIDQRIIVQLLWGEKVIEFFADVLDRSDKEIYITPYIHNGVELELNVTKDKVVQCNLFADDPFNNQRVSWKGIELTTVERNSKKVYCVATSGYNQMSNHDDRRQHDRVVVNIKAQVCDSHNDKISDVIVRDISDIGVSFYALDSFAPSGQLTLSFSDTVDNRTYDAKVDFIITRTEKNQGNTLYGCKVLGENKDYLLYGFIQRLLNKNRHNIASAAENASDSASVENANNTDNTENNSDSDNNNSDNNASEE